MTWNRRIPLANTESLEVALDAERRRLILCKRAFALNSLAAETWANLWKEVLAGKQSGPIYLKFI